MATTSDDLKEVEGETTTPEDPKNEGQSDQTTSNSEVIATSGTNETSNQDQPNVDANTESSDVNQPDADADQPSADADQPNADADQPTSADADQPNADADQPSADADQPSTDADQPNADADQPNADADQPSTDADQPSADADQPSADADQPSADADQPNTDADQKEDTRRRSVYCNQPLETYIWTPEAQDIKGLVCICHGVHEHMGRYEKLAEHLKSSGLLVFGIDLVGHGKSEGVRGLIDDLQSYATDLIRVAEEMKEKYPEPPMFLMGHSMGGLVATIVAIQRQSMFLGLLLSAPSLIVDPNAAGPVKRLLARIIGAIAPNLGISSLNTATISSLPEEVEEYTNDPLIIHTPLKAGWSVALIKGMQYAEGRLGNISIPLFIMHGSDDQLVPVAASQLIHSNASSTDKTLEVFGGSRHEILHDKEQDRARQLMSSWILSRITSKQETAPDN